MKGDTSLSKGYALIDRFSEDVDILIQPAKGDSAKSRERLLQTITEDLRSGFRGACPVCRASSV